MKRMNEKLPEPSTSLKFRSGSILYFIFFSDPDQIVISNITAKCSAPSYDRRKMEPYIRMKPSRAVARACAANPVAIVIPCHRVVAKTGGVGGYRWGPERKAKLFAMEKQKRLS